MGTLVRTERFDDPASIDGDRIAALIAEGVRPIVQFSKPGTPDGLLDTVNQLCLRHGAAVDVRFYGHYGGAFDCRLLRRLPAVVSLSLSCLQDVEHLEDLLGLDRLLRLELDIYHLDHPSILAAPAFRQLESLVVGGTERGNLSLAPVAEMPALTDLLVAGQATALAALGHCTQLRALSLHNLKKSDRLGFVSKLERLESLRLILGGREDLCEIEHDGLTELEIVRVRGLSSFRPASFPKLRTLVIEDQIRLTELVFDARNSELRSLRLVNCKNLARLEGLALLPKLEALRSFVTKLDADVLLAQGVPKSLQTLAFYTGKERVNRAIRAKLDALGYREFEPSE